jgi:hypothetical protein
VAAAVALLRALESQIDGAHFELVEFPVGPRNIAGEATRFRLLSLNN